MWIRVSDTHELRKGHGKHRERPIAGRGACAALTPRRGESKRRPARLLGPPSTQRRLRPLRGAEAHKPEMRVESKNVRLCSLMFAYVRLMGKNLLRARRTATGGGQEGRRRNVECRMKSGRPQGNAKCTTDGSRRIKVMAT